MASLTPSNHAQLGCDYLDELLQALETNGWCFENTFGIERKVSEHAEALGLRRPLDRPSKAEHETPRELQLWLRIHDPLTDSARERIIGRIVFAPPPAPARAVLKIAYYPLEGRTVALLHGAYRNVYHFRDGVLLGHPGMELHAASGQRRDDPSYRQVHQGMTYDAAGGPYAIIIKGHSLPGSTHGLIADCRIRGYTQAAVVVDDAGEDEGGEGAGYTFRHCVTRNGSDLQPEDVRIESLHPDSEICIEPRRGLLFGATLGVVAAAQLWITVNGLAALLAAAGLLGYVFVYTLWLKPRTPQNIVLGGAAGAMPPLVGWAAATGGLTAEALWPFAIVFFWTPPHFWALSLLMKEEYARAGVPMLPVVRGERETRRQILLYTILLYAVTQLPFCAGAFGLTYLAISVVLGGAFIAGAVLLCRRADRRTALRLYLFSLAYLALLFAAMVADVRL